MLKNNILQINLTLTCGFTTICQIYPRFQSNEVNNEEKTESSTKRNFKCMHAIYIKFILLNIFFNFHICIILDLARYKAEEENEV